MLAIGRALMSRPKIILFDGPSLGVAPPIIEQVFQIIPQLKQARNLTVLPVEQSAAMAPEAADDA
jgi:branched-chain amino acid transport system ATP-binding protein